MKVSDTILCVLSDMHTGSSTALFPRQGYQGEGTEANHVMPNEKQMEIYHTFARFIGEVAKARKGKRLIVVNLGDAIDGFHHGSMQESLFKEQDQSAAHVLLMTDFLKRVAFDKKKGDELYYVRGTEVHVKEAENKIAKELGAVCVDPTVEKDKRVYVHEILTLNINGLQNVFAHHGKARGTGQNEGNALRNFLRDVRDDREKDGLPRIDILWSGHTHAATWNTHIRRIGSGEFHQMHGVICPSWQSKTRYALAKMAMAVNSVGGTYGRISVDGTFSCPRFVVQTTRDG